ncbi:phage tail protein [Streptomyces paludis]|uniref:Phage tail protein n=1 Tax=Streptomyces paludis TaxID=2282738 RepID=A0A345HJ57_9ACTN|nr:phage tail protein [Streptomyces paludis]AXG76731.1 phage tail protein [Streptomyces paludis]
MRATVPGLASPHPLVELLPALYLEQDFVRRFLSALDDVLAPVQLTLDNLPAHLDPRSAPEDFLDWVAQWVAAEPRPDEPVDRRRTAVTEAVARHSRRGTRGGLSDAVARLTGVVPEIEESGGSAWSPTPYTDLPGDERARVVVRLRVADPDGVDRVGVEELIEGEIPAHIGYALEILPSTTDGTPGASGAPGASGGTP